MKVPWSNTRPHIKRMEATTQQKVWEHGQIKYIPDNDCIMVDNSKDESYIEQIQSKITQENNKTELYKLCVEWSNFKLGNGSHTVLEPLKCYLKKLDPDDPDDKVCKFNAEKSTHDIEVCKLNAIEWLVSLGTNKLKESPVYKNSDQDDKLFFKKLTMMPGSSSSLQLLQKLQPDDSDLQHDATSRIAVAPQAIGTRHEGFKCDFCKKPLGAMNTLHTDEWEIDDDGGSSDGAGASGPEGVTTTTKQQVSERHEGVRLCGECSVGHCPECGTQLVPHLPPTAQKQPGKGKGKKEAAGVKTVLWYAQLGRGADVVIRCPNGDYETTMKAGNVSSAYSASSAHSAAASSAHSAAVSSQSQRSSGKLRFATGENESRGILHRCGEAETTTPRIIKYIYT